MKKLFLICITLILTTFSVLTLAGVANDVSSTITLQLQAEQWVTTNTAQVVVNADAILAKAGLTETREQIMQKLNDLAKNADWHITAFNTSQNESGLVQLHVAAQARVAEDIVNNLQNKVKDISKPGLTFKIVNINFTPSLLEFEQARATLRSKIYKEAQQEVARLNKVYPRYNFVIRDIDFKASPRPPMPLAANVMLFRGATAVGAAKNGKFMGVLAVSSKIQMTATVSFASSSDVRAKVKT